MPRRSKLDFMFGTGSLPDLAADMPLSDPSDYPAAIELENNATASQGAPGPPAQASRECGNPHDGQAALNLPKGSAPRMLDQQHSRDTTGPGQTATSSRRRSNSSVVGSDDFFTSTTSISHIATNGSTDTQHLMESCPNPTDPSCGDQNVARQPSPASLNTLQHMKDQLPPVPGLRSNASMLNRWHAQPLSQEPYTPIQDAHSSRVTGFRPSANAGNR